MLQHCWIGFSFLKTEISNITWRDSIAKRMRCSESSDQKEIYSCKCLHWKRRKISNLTLYHKNLEKEKKTKPNASRRKEIIKIRAEIFKNREKENNRTIKIKSFFSEKINKIDKPLAILTKKKSLITKIRNEIGSITTNLTKIKGIIKEYCEQLYAKKSDTVEEMDKFLETYIPPKLKK